MGPFFIISTGGPLLYYFNGWGPGLLYYFNGWVPSLLFQRMRPLLYYFNGWGLFYYFNGCMGPLLNYFNGWGPFFIISRESFFFFFRIHMLAQSHTPNIYSPPLFHYYNPFTIVSHKRLSAYLFRAALGPAHLCSSFVGY